MLTILKLDSWEPHLCTAQVCFGTRMMSRSSSSTGFKKGSSRETGYAEFTASTLAVQLLNVAGNVHEEGDWQQEGLHNVGGVEVSTSINLCPLGVVIVEPWMTQNSWHCSKLGPNCPIYCIYIKDIYIYILYIYHKRNSQGTEGCHTDQHRRRAWKGTQARWS